MQQVTWVVVDDHGSDAEASGLPLPDRVVCADSGVAHALALGLHVDVVVGDLDSVSASDLATVVAAGAEVESYDPDKDATDLALSLRRAARDAAPGDLIIVLAGAGGRLDHALANVHAVADPALAHVRVHARIGVADVHVVRDEAALDLPLGATVTLLPSGGPAEGVCTDGLRYPLDREDLPAWSTRGISNVVTGSPVHITLTAGCLLVVVPLPRKDER